MLFFGDYEEMTHSLRQLGAPIVSKLEVAEQAQVSPAYNRPPRSLEAATIFQVHICLWERVLKEEHCAGPFHKGLCFSGPHVVPPGAWHASRAQHSPHELRIVPTLHKQTW